VRHVESGGKYLRPARQHEAVGAAGLVLSGGP
jgi:hypothetical protein